MVDFDFDFNLFFVLDEDHNVIVEPNIMEWLTWIHKENNRIVKQETIFDGECLVFVSTVFFGIDLGMGREKEPLVFETMIFEGKHHGEIIRYYTWDEAIAGHNKIIKLYSDQKAKNDA